MAGFVCDGDRFATRQGEDIGGRSRQAAQLCLGIRESDFFNIGTGGLAVANQIYNKFRAEGKKLADGDIQIVDAAEFHHYQPGW